MIIAHRQVRRVYVENKTLFQFNSQLVALKRKKSMQNRTVVDFFAKRRKRKLKLLTTVSTNEVATKFDF